MRVIRKLEYNGETLTTINDEQGLFMEYVDSLRQVAEELLYTCTKITDSDVILINKEELLERHPSMYPQVYGEDDPLWIEFEKNYERRPVIKPPRKKLKGHIYFLKCRSTNLYKIGYSTSIKTRVKDIKNNSPTKIDLIGYVASVDCFSDEKNYHEIFEHKRVKGEWFALTEEDLDSIEGITYDNQI